MPNIFVTPALYAKLRAVKAPNQSFNDVIDENVHQDAAGFSQFFGAWKGLDADALRAELKQGRASKHEKLAARLGAK